MSSWLWSTHCPTTWISGEILQHNRGFRGVLQLWPRSGSRGEDESCVHWEWVESKPCWPELCCRYVVVTDPSMCDFFQICSIWTLRFSFTIYKSTPYLCLNSVSLVQHYNGFTTYWLQDSSHLVFAVRTPIIRANQKHFIFWRKLCTNNNYLLFAEASQCLAFVVWSSYKATQSQ